MLNAAPALMVTVAALAVGLAAQVDQEELLKRRDAKLAEPWVKAGSWIVDYDAALAESERTGKPIFAYFTRSYAPCPPCIALEMRVLSTPAFAAFARQVVPYLHVVSRVEGEPHEKLMMQKGGTGFPFLCFMNRSGHLLARHNGPRSVGAFEKSMRNEVVEYLAIEKKAATGDAEAKYLHLFRRLDLGVDYATARKMADGLRSLRDDRRERLEQRLTNLEYDELKQKAEISRDYEIAEVGCSAMFKAGRQPETSRRVLNFWVFVIKHSERMRDVKTFAKALNRMDQHSGDAARVRAFVREHQAKLARMQRAIAAEPVKKK